MSIESLQRQPDLTESILRRNKNDKANGHSHSPYTTWALMIKDEATNSQRHKNKKDRKLTWVKDRSAILFALAHLAIEQALVEGVFDSTKMIAVYNEAVIGTKFEKFFDTGADPERIPEQYLEKMREYSANDSTWAVFFTDMDAYRFLPPGLLTFFAYMDSNARENIANTVVKPTFSPVAERIPPPYLTNNLNNLFKREVMPTKDEADRIFRNLTSGWQPKTSES